MNPRIKVTMPEETLGMRLDKALSIALSKTRNHIEILFDEGHIWVNGKNEKPSYRVKENDVVEYEEKELVPSEMKKENIPLDIVYEDEDLMVINKPRHGRTSC